MDTWALHRFSTDQALQEQFLAAFQDRGTLLISLMLAVEIVANASPARPELRAFLDAIGPYWVPLTIDPWAVINSQEQRVVEHLTRASVARSSRIRSSLRSCTVAASLSRRSSTSRADRMVSP